MSTAPTPPPPSGRHRLAVVLVLAAAIAAFTAAVLTADTGDDDAITQSGDIEAVEHVVPRNGDEVVRQSEIGIDLAPGHDGRLIVDGVEIPDDELRIVDAQNQVFFQPGEGKSVDQLPPGRTCVTAIVWRQAVGRGVDDDSVTWCFSVV